MVWFKRRGVFLFVKLLRVLKSSPAPLTVDSMKKHTVILLGLMLVYTFSYSQTSESEYMFNAMLSHLVHDAETSWIFDKYPVLDNSKTCSSGMFFNTTNSPYEGVASKSIDIKNGCIIFGSLSYFFFHSMTPSYTIEKWKYSNRKAWCQIALPYGT